MPPIVKISAQSPGVPAARAGAETRRFGAVDSPVSVVLNAGGSRGSFSADVPLDSFKPPLRPSDLAGRVVKISMPPNDADPAPASITTKNGRSYLRLELRDADISALLNAPIIFGVGEAAQMQGQVAAPDFVAQVNVRDIRSDRTAPMLALARQDRVHEAQLLGSYRAERAALADGTSSWFGTRPLQIERDALLKKTQATQAQLGVLRASAEQAMAAADPMLVALAMPREAGDREVLMHALGDDANRRVALATAIKNQQTARAAGVPTDVTGFDAKVDAARAALGEDPRGEAMRRYVALKAEDPGLADRWLTTFATLAKLPDQGPLSDLVDQATSLKMSVELNASTLDRLEQQTARELPLRLEQLDQQIADARARLAATDASITALNTGKARPIDPFTTRYSPDRKFI